MLKCATDLIATIVVLSDCIDRRNLVIASEAKQSRAAGQQGRWARDCFVAPPLAMTAQPGERRVGLQKRSRSPRSGRDPVLNRNNVYEAGMPPEVVAHPVGSGGRQHRQSRSSHDSLLEGVPPIAKLPRYSSKMGKQ